MAKQCICSGHRETNAILLFSSTAYQQPQDQRYTGYAQPDYSAQQYGATTDYNAPAADYSQTTQYDGRSYGYGKTFSYHY